MIIGQKGIALIKEFEGCRLSAYLDSVGVPTIGYGHIHGVKMGDTCTQAQADAWLETVDIIDAEKGVNGSILVKLNQNQFDALVSFTYNLGVGNLRASTLLRMVNKQDFAGASGEFKKWNLAGGKPVDGLTRRRDAESKLFKLTC